MCEELPLEYEQPFTEILNTTLQQYQYHNHTSNDIVFIITSYLFCNEYYFRRDCHSIDCVHHTITLFLYQSKFCVNLFRLTCPIRGNAFLKYIDSISSVESTPNTTITNNTQYTIETIQNSKLKAWIDTECKNDKFSRSRSANMEPNSSFLMMTYFEESRQNIMPWLVQWKYNNYSMPYIQVITRIISYPSDWNYVTLSYANDTNTENNIVSAVFYTSQEQHSIQFLPQSEDNCDIKEKVSIVRFGNGLNYPWLMFGSAATNALNYNDIILLFGNKSSKLLIQNNAMDINNEYFVTRSCENFVEMRDHGAFWTTARDHISIFQITEKRCTKKYVYNSDEKQEEESVDFNVLCQFPIFTNPKNGDCNYNKNILDVTVSGDWSLKFQRKYGIGCAHKLFMVLYTEIRYDIETTDLYCAYIDVKSGKVETFAMCKLASSKCLTKFLVGRGSYQTVYNDWMCTLIGVDESNHEVRHQLRLTEELSLLYYQRVTRNENVQECTNRYECKALKYFKRAQKEELEMQRSNNAPQIMHGLWRNIVDSRYLIVSTLVGAFIGWRVSRAMRNGRLSIFMFSNT